MVGTARDDEASEYLGLNSSTIDFMSVLLTSTDQHLQTISNTGIEGRLYQGLEFGSSFKENSYLQIKVPMNRFRLATIKEPEEVDTIKRAIGITQGLEYA